MTCPFVCGLASGFGIGIARYGLGLDREFVCVAFRKFEFLENIKNVGAMMVQSIQVVEVKDSMVFGLDLDSISLSFGNHC